MATKTKGERVGARIRSFHEADIAAVTTILLEAPEAAHWTEESYRQALNWPGVVAFVSDGDGKVTGFMIGRQMGHEAEILNLAVVSVGRCRGEGGALLKAALEKFRSRGVSRVFLEVRESNETGIGFYEKRGFFKTGKRPRYYGAPEEAAVLMEMKLAG